MAIIREISPIATKRCQNSFVNDYFYGVTGAITLQYSVGNWDLNCQQNIYSLSWKPILIAGTLMHLVRCPHKSSTKTSYILQRVIFPKNFGTLVYKHGTGNCELVHFPLQLQFMVVGSIPKCRAKTYSFFLTPRWAVSPATVQKFSLLLWREEHVNCIESWSADMWRVDLPVYNNDHIDIKWQVIMI